MNREINTDLYSLLDIISRAKHDHKLFFEELFGLTGDIEDCRWMDRSILSEQGWVYNRR